MHEHDQEIIMALAEGTLDDATAAVAEAGLADCVECMRDLELQRLAVDALGEVAPVFMSATESARLHTALKDELAIASPAPARKQPRPAWGRWAGLAVGAAAMFLGVVLVLPTVLGGSGDSADTAAVQEIARDGFEEQDDAADDAATAPASAESMQASPLNDRSSTDEAAGGDSPIATTTASPSTLPLAVASQLPYALTGELSEDIRADVIDRLLADTSTFRSADAAAKAAAPYYESCLAETISAEHADDTGLPAGSEPQLLGFITGDDGEERLLVAYLTTDVNETVLAVITIPTCQVFQTIP